MKFLPLAYQLITGLFVLLMLVNVYNYFFNPTLRVAFAHLGFPDWFRVELGLAKLLGALALAIPLVPARVKEWAYVGFFLSFFSAIIAHHAVGDPVSNQVFPFLVLLLLVASYLTFQRVAAPKTVPTRFPSEATS